MYIKLFFQYWNWYNQKLNKTKNKTYKTTTEELLSYTQKASVITSERISLSLRNSEYDAWECRTKREIILSLLSSKQGYRIYIDFLPVSQPAVLRTIVKPEPNLPLSGRSIWCIARQINTITSISSLISTRGKHFGKLAESIKSPVKPDQLILEYIRELASTIHKLAETQIRLNTTDSPT